MTDLAALYSKQQIHLWVEDTLTREYLRELWDDVSIRIWVGAGGALNEIVEASREELPALKIFRLNDGDWAPRITVDLPTNAHGYRLSRHEIENYLLDSDALTNTRFRQLKRDVDAQAAEAHLSRQAQRLIPVVACTRVLNSLKQELNVGRWPKDPTRDSCPDRTTAARWLTAQLREVRDAIRTTRLGADAAQNEGHVLDRLELELANAQGEHDNGGWRRTFPGKEILRGAWTDLFTAPQSGAREADLAKHIAAQQRKNNSPLAAELAPWLAHMRRR